MGIAKKTDGRHVVGVGVDNANDYRGSAAYRDIYIQLTSSGATEKSEEYLNYLKDYAIHANSLGEPIMPPSVDVWISNNGVTTAVEADDVSIDGNNYTICGIAWNGSSWDYSNAGQGSGGGLPEVTSADEGKVLAVNASGEWAVGQKIFYHIYDEGEGVYNLTPEQAFELFRTGVQIVDYGGYIDTDDTTTVYAGRKEYVRLLYNAGVYKLTTGVDTLVADTFTSHFYVD